MYRIMIETWVDDERQMNGWYAKFYTRKGNAKNIAKSLFKDVITKEGKHLVQRAIVVNDLKLVTKEEAREAYSNYRRVWVEESYGLRLLPDPGCFGSHAPGCLLFYRTHSDNYKGNYWLEADDRKEI